MDPTPASRTVQRACTIFMKDLEAMPAEAFDKQFGPATRTVADIVYEVNLVNDHIGMVIRGEEPFEWPDDGWIKAPEDFRTKDAVIAGFKESSERILATIDALSPEELSAPLSTKEGITTRHDRSQFVALHLWYHSGQLNFIQTLLGDDAWHW